jgi:hypothetical protein
MKDTFTPLKGSKIHWQASILHVSNRRIIPATGIELTHINLFLSLTNDETKDFKTITDNLFSFLRLFLNYLLQNGLLIRIQNDITIYKYEKK